MSAEAACSAAAAQASTASALRSRKVRRCSGLGCPAQAWASRVARPAMRSARALRSRSSVTRVAAHRSRSAMRCSRRPQQVGQALLEAGQLVGRTLVFGHRNPESVHGGSRGRRVQPAGRCPGRRECGRSGGATLFAFLPAQPAPAARPRRRPSCRPARPALRPPTPGAGVASTRTPGSPARPRAGRRARRPSRRSAAPRVVGEGRRPADGRPRRRRPLAAACFAAA